MGAAQPPPTADSSLCIWRGDVFVTKKKLFREGCGMGGAGSRRSDLKRVGIRRGVL